MGLSLTRDQQSAWASVDIIKEELSTESGTLDELVIQELEAQVRLQILGDEKKAQEKLLESAHKPLSKRDLSSSTVISSVVAHAVALLKSQTPDLDVEKLQRDFSFDNDEERDTIVDSIYDTAQYFVS
jgi:DNA repair protein RadC